MALISEYCPEAWDYLIHGKGRGLPLHAKDIITELAEEVANSREAANAISHSTKSAEVTP